MGKKIEQIERPHFIKAKPKAGFRKWLKNQRNRNIRRTSVSQDPFMGYGGWQYELIIELPGIIHSLPAF